MTDNDIDFKQRLAQLDNDFEEHDQALDDLRDRLAELKRSVDSGGGGGGGENVARFGTNPGSAVPADSRPLVSNSYTRLRVPQDVPTIQEAVNQVPWYLRHDFDIRIDQDRSYADEHVEIPPVIAADESRNKRAAGLELMSQSSSSGNWEVGSIRVFNAMGSRAVRLSYPKFTSVNPSDNYDQAFMHRGGGGEVQLYSPAFGNISQNSGVEKPYCICSYSGHTHLGGDVDFGTDANRGAFTIHGGKVTSQAKTVTGDVSGILLAAHGGGDIRMATVGSAGYGRLMNTTHGGMAVVEDEQRALIGGIEVTG